MSKRLAISSAFSVFATAALALFAAAGGPEAARQNIAGAPIEIKAPTELSQLPKLSALPFLSN
jgi:hypothetical protein